MTAVRSARAPWSGIVLVCRKCARKTKRGNFRKDLKSALKAADAGRRIRVVETGCLDLCPKHRIVLATGQTLAATRLLVVLPNGAAEAARTILSQSLPEASAVRGTIDSPMAPP